MSIFGAKTEAKTNYESGVELGKRYRDPQTGIEGVATSLHFYQHGCERATLELLVKGELKEYTFDSPRLVEIETQKQVTSPRTGGPGDGVNQASSRASTPSR
jgi:hypothetical protein